MKISAYEKGRIGEAEVKKFLLCKKYIILETNYKISFGEIDIIAKDSNNLLRFIEVKNKINANIEDIIFVFLNRNLKHYYKIIEYYIYKNKIESSYFIDLIILDKTKILFYPNISQELYSL